MFWARTALGLLGCLVSSGLCALSLQYGTFFQISGIQLQEGRPVLPVSRGKYADIRVLDKATFAFLTTCPSDCLQPSEEGAVSISRFRAAKTQGNMWIADVEIDQRWLITFLVFRKGNTYRFGIPEEFVFLDEHFQKQVEEMLAKQAADFSDK